jgi:hypothetical protein
LLIDVRVRCTSIQVAGTGMSPLHLLPQAWQADLAQHTIEPIRTGSGGALVYRVEGRGSPARFLKIAESIPRLIEDSAEKSLHLVVLWIPMR